MPRLCTCMPGQGTINRWSFRRWWGKGIRHIPVHNLTTILDIRVYKFKGEEINLGGGGGGGEGGFPYAPSSSPPPK